MTFSSRLTVAVLMCGTLLSNSALTTAAAEGKNDFQYAAKFVCGANGDEFVVAPGRFFTTVNIHNPHTEAVEFRTKVAVAEQEKDGEITWFAESTISPDGAQYFNCGIIKSRLKLPSSAFVDGFFVIEARRSLDVVGVYTDNSNKGPAQNTSALDVEVIPERTIPYQYWCPRVEQSLSGAPWTVTDPDGNTVQAQISPNPHSAWTTSDSGGSRSWLVYADQNNPNEVSIKKEGTYTYSLDFCSCGGQGQVVGNARADNVLAPGNQNDTLYKPGSSVGSPLFGSSVNSPQDTFQSNKNSVPFDVTFTGNGQGRVDFLVGNQGYITGLSLQGKLVLQSGYLGQCKSGKAVVSNDHNKGR